jgi:hypothetical protein
MDNPLARHYDEMMTVALESTRFADELRHWRHTAGGASWSWPCAPARPSAT